MKLQYVGPLSISSNLIWLKDTKSLETVLASSFLRQGRFSQDCTVKLTITIEELDEPLHEVAEDGRVD